MSSPRQAPSTNYNGYNLKDRIFCDADGRVEWREAQELSDSKENVKRREWSKKRFREQKGKPLCEVLSPELAKVAEAEFTRQKLNRPAHEVALGIWLAGLSV